MSPARHHHALPAGYRLHWYEIESVLGQGGFGITYLAHDHNLDQPVAIKEFLPSDLAVRTQDSAVHPLTEGHTDTFGWGLNRFLTEARTLAKFRHPNIVRVLSVFEANNTAYMVMEYELGESFESTLRSHRIEGEETLKGILLALLNGLALVHDAGFIHRDIKPSNVYLREDGVPVLLDFGSARLALGVETRTLTSLVSPGYAPFEQYNATRESDKQGPWTDIYALGATVYRAVTGQGPVDAAARANLLLDEGRDPFQPCAKIASDRYSLAFLHAIDRALAFKPTDRPQSVQAWRELLVAEKVDADALTSLASEDETVVRDAVDFVVDEHGTDQAAGSAKDATIKTVPLTRPGPPDETIDSASPAASGRRWFVATGIVVVAGVAAMAGLTLAPRLGDSEGPDASPVATVTGNAESASPPASATQSPPSTAIAATAPSAAAAVTASATSSEPTTQLPTASVTPTPAPSPATIPTAASSESTMIQPSTAGEPSVERPVTTTAAPAPKTPPPATEKKETAAKLKPTTTAAAEPPKAPEQKNKQRKTPVTREEKIAYALDQAEADMKAGKLTKPKKKNAYERYLWVVANEPDNSRGRRGVERVAERCLALARNAADKGRIDDANDYLRQARKVIKGMKLRKWSPGALSSLQAEYQETKQLLANR